MIRQRLAVFAADQLPADVIKAFKQLGDLQRGAPEQAMLRVQFAMGGGVLNPVVEHVGDITHRMSHLAEYGVALGRDKITKTLRWLKHGYGFEREYRQNVVNNARARGVPAEELQAKITKLLRQYAEAHDKLPVYNQAQWLARQAAVMLGLEKFQRATDYLQRLEELAPDEATFAVNAFKFTKDANGKLMEYTPGRNMP